MRVVTAMLLASAWALHWCGQAGGAEPMELLAALQQGRIQAEFYGNGDQSVRGRIRPAPFGPEQVIVAPGTQFWAQQPGLQGMTTVGWVPIDLRNRPFVFVEIPTACTNYDRPAPSRWHRMIPYPCPSPAMAALSETAAKLQPDRAVVQLAVWAVANDPEWEQVVGYAQAHAAGESEQERATGALSLRQQAAGLLRSAWIDPAAFRMFAPAPEQ